MPFPTHILAAGGIVTNERGEVLLVRHTDHKGWGFPGGQVENGETVPEAVAREILEESGIVATVERLVCVTSNTSGYTARDGVSYIPTKIMLDFACRYVSGEVRGSDETHEAAWFPKEEAMARIDTEAYRERFSAFLRGGPVQYLAYETHPTYVLHDRRDL